MAPSQAALRAAERMNISHRGSPRKQNTTQSSGNLARLATLQRQDRISADPLQTSLPELPSSQRHVLPPVATASSTYVPLRSCLSHKNLSSHTNTSTSPSTANTIPKSVSFHTVQIRAHKLMLGDNPSVSSGPALSLDWDCIDHSALNVEDYEAHRPPRRTRLGLTVPRHVREEWLRVEAGVTRGEMETASRIASKIKHSRHKASLGDGTRHRPGVLLKRMLFKKDAERMDAEVEALLVQGRQAEAVRERQRQAYLQEEAAANRRSSTDTTMVDTDDDDDDNEVNESTGTIIESSDQQAAGQATTEGPSSTSIPTAPASSFLPDATPNKQASAVVDDDYLEF